MCFIVKVKYLADAFVQSNLEKHPAQTHIYCLDSSDANQCHQYRITMVRHTLGKDLLS